MDYQVSRDGTVLGKRGRPIGQIKRGYRRVSIDGKYVSVHRLVAAAFLGDIAGKEVHHKNGIKTDNRAENLEICTRTEHCGYLDETVRRIRAGLALGVPVEAYAAIGYPAHVIEPMRMGLTYKDAPGPTPHAPTERTQQYRIEFPLLRMMGQSREEIAWQYGCSKRTVSRYWQ